MTSRHLNVALATLVALATGCGDRAEPARPPNLLLVVIDTLRADHLGAYGYARPTSPHIDALAARGVRLSQYFSNSSWTRPAMATLLTGRYARSVGIYKEKFDALPDDVLTLAERLTAAGYITLGITSNPNINTGFGFAQGFADYSDSGGAFAFMPGFRPRRHNRLDTADAVTDRALSVVDRHADAIAAAPFFLQVLYIDPHRPFEAPAEHAEAVGGIEARHGRYDAEIHFADAELGRLLGELRSRGLLDDALVVVTSDHGEGLDDHGRDWWTTAHGYHLYDSVLRIPLILAGDGLPEGVVIDALASTVDLLPTLLDLLGLDPGADPGPGRSLAAAIRGDGAAPPVDAVFSETDWRFARKRSVRTRTYKLIANDDARAQREAYRRAGLTATSTSDDASAPVTNAPPSRFAVLEQTPPVEVYEAGAPEGRGAPQSGESQRAALEARLRAWDEATPRRAAVEAQPGGEDGAEPTEIDADTLQRLRELGYMEE